MKYFTDQLSPLISSRLLTNFSRHAQILPLVIHFFISLISLLMQISLPHLSPHPPSHHPSSIPLLTLTLTLSYLPRPTLIYSMLSLWRVHTNPTIIPLIRSIHAHSKPCRLRLQSRGTLALVWMMSIVTICSCLCKSALGSDLG